MTKKQNSIVKMVTGTVLAATMAFSMALPTLAADYSSGDSSDNPAKAAITKIFKMPIDTPTPAAQFVFTFDKVGMDDPLDDSTTAKNGMPAIADVTIDFAANVDPAGGGVLGETFISSDGATKSIAKESTNFLAGMIGDSYWANGEGIYRYQVYENMTPSTGSDITFALPPAVPPAEGADYSVAKYDVEIWVEKDTNNILYPKFVVVRIVAGSEDEYYEGTPGGEKVDPTPGGVNPGNPPSIEDTFSQFIFTNKYWRTDGGGTTDPDKFALEIIKKVTGSGSAPDLLTKYFDFTVMVTQPGVIPTTGIYPAAQIYKAYIMDKNGNIVTDTSGDYKNGTISGTDANGDYFLFTSDIPKNIKLRNDERLVFVDLHIGSKVEAEEIPTVHYAPSYKRTFGPGITSSITEVSFAGSSADASDTVAFGFPRDPEDNGPHYTKKGDKQNIATFTNTRKGATPTGISVDNLPFLVLIGAAIASLVGFVVIKSRKNAKYYA